MFFAVHPVVVEAVCEPTVREDLLVAAFTLAAFVIAAGIRWIGPSPAVMRTFVNRVFPGAKAAAVLDCQVDVARRDHAPPAAELHALLGLEQ
jgi:pyruvate carboxylase